MTPFSLAQAAPPDAPASPEVERYQQAMRQSLDEVLASPQFSDMDDTEGQWARSLLDWIGSLFRGAGQAVDSLPEWALWTITGWCILILLLIFGHVLYTLFGSWRSKHPDDWMTYQQPEQAPGPLLGIRDLDAAAIAKQAHAFLSAGQTEMALRYFYAAMILRLDQMRRLRYQPAKTNRDYLRELPATDSAHAAFERVTRSFEAAVFGRRGATADECTFAASALRELEAEQRTA